MRVRSLLTCVALAAAAAAGRAAPVERVFQLEAPATVAAGEDFHVTITASTNAGNGEQVGMFQVDASLDDGRTWKPARYLDTLGAATRQQLDLQAGAAGSVVRIRARVAFRGGFAGNVDHTGRAIRWHDSWDAWAEPPALSRSIPVSAARR